MRRRKRESVWTGMAAGMAGGLAASWMMGVAHSFLGRAAGANFKGGVQDPTVEAASALSRRFLQRELDTREKYIAGPLIHYAFGTLVGGLYGTAATVLPGIRAGAGVPFGVAVWAGAHAAAVPALGLAESPYEQPLASGVVELAAHLIYGGATELIRRGIVAAARE